VKPRPVLGSVLAMAAWAFMVWLWAGGVLFVLRAGVRPAAVLGNGLLMFGLGLMAGYVWFGGPAGAGRPRTADTRRRAWRALMITACVGVAVQLVFARWLTIVGVTMVGFPAYVVGMFTYVTFVNLPAAIRRSRREAEVPRRPDDRHD